MKMKTIRSETLITRPYNVKADGLPKLTGLAAARALGVLKSTKTNKLLDESEFEKILSGKTTSVMEPESISKYPWKLYKLAMVDAYPSGVRALTNLLSSKAMPIEFKDWDDIEKDYLLVAGQTNGSGVLVGEVLTGSAASDFSDVFTAIMAARDAEPAETEADDEEPAAAEPEEERPAVTPAYIGLMASFAKTMGQLDTYPKAEALEMLRQAAEILVSGYNFYENLYDGARNLSRGEIDLVTASYVLKHTMIGDVPPDALATALAPYNVDIKLVVDANKAAAAKQSQAKSKKSNAGNGGKAKAKQGDKPAAPTPAQKSQSQPSKSGGQAQGNGKSGSSKAPQPAKKAGGSSGGSKRSHKAEQPYTAAEILAMIQDYNTSNPDNQVSIPVGFTQELMRLGESGTMRAAQLNKLADAYDLGIEFPRRDATNSSSGKER